MNVVGMQAATVACIRPCLAPFETMRPSLSAFVESDWFRSDRCLSALIFLESIVEKPDAQRVAVVRELPSLLPSFDRNVLSKRVLPPHSASWVQRASSQRVLAAWRRTYTKFAVLVRFVDAEDADAVSQLTECI